MGESRVGWALIRGWALINFLCLKDGRLFEVGANSRLGAYSNKYGRIAFHRGVGWGWGGGTRECGPW